MTMYSRSVFSCLLCLSMSAWATSASIERSNASSLMDGWAFGMPPPPNRTAMSARIQPQLRDGRLSSLVLVRYQGNDAAALEAALKGEVATLRRDMGGATFGVDGNSGVPVPLDGAMLQWLIDALRKAPALAEDVRAKAGVMEAIFEIRPALQPRDSNFYLHAIYDAKTREYLLRSTLDDPSTPLREDITGINVDTGSGSTGQLP